MSIRRKTAYSIVLTDLIAERARIDKLIEMLTKQRDDEPVEADAKAEEGAAE